MNPIPAERVVAEVRRLAAEKPGFIYESDGWCEYRHDESDGRCEYRHDGVVGSGCIIGQALDAIDPEWFHPDLNFSNVCDLFHFHVIDATTEQRNWLVNVQACQDNQEPWALAVASADRLQAAALQARSS